MMETQQGWKKTTADLYKAVQIYAWAGVASAVIGFFGWFADKADAMQSLASGRMSVGFGVWDVLDILATVAIVYGYWLFLKSLDIFKGQVLAPDAPRIANIRTATILALIGVVVALIPVIGWAGSILNLIGWIMMLVAYVGLKNSATFPELARNGASKLFVAMILGVIGGVLGFIPLVGGIFEFILDVVAFILVLIGWKRIAESEAPVAA